MADNAYNLGADVVVTGFTGSGSFDFNAHFEFLDVPQDSNPPVVTIVSPAGAVFSTIPSRATALQTPIVLTVDDVEPGLRVVVIWVKFSTRAETIMAFDGTKFRPPFLGPSTFQVVGNQHQFSVLELGGWEGDVEEFFVLPVDRAGNLEGSLPPA